MFFTLFSSASVWLTILVGTVIAVLPDIIIAVIENVLEARYFEKLEQNEFHEKKRTYQKILHYFKHRSISNFVVNDNISLRNVPNFKYGAEPDDGLTPAEQTETTEID
jgi:hypothetical protein